MSEYLDGLADTPMMRERRSEHDRGQLEFAARLAAELENRPPRPAGDDE